MMRVAKQRCEQPKLKRILAISGGIDSMSLLDFSVKMFPREELVIASFDHGTRVSAKQDVDFVAELGPALQIPVYRGGVDENGQIWLSKIEPQTEPQTGKFKQLVNRAPAKLSEEAARKLRYDFLFKVAFLEHGEIYTAQHVDDLIESIAINLIRGTGFRGLAAMTRLGIRRPFLETELSRQFLKMLEGTEDRASNQTEGKITANSEDETEAKAGVERTDILRYAAKYHIKFREDPTNASDDYLRNRIRQEVRESAKSTKQQLYQLWQKQKATVREINQISEAITPENLEFTRDWFRLIPPEVGQEILRTGLARARISLTRPQMHDFYAAILDYRPGKYFNLPGDQLVRINKDSFQLMLQ